MGGGVSTVNASLTARRSNFTGNIARLDGGGLRVSYLSTASLDACRLAFNNGEQAFWSKLYCMYIVRFYVLVHLLSSFYSAVLKCMQAIDARVSMGS